MYFVVWYFYVSGFRVKVFLLQSTNLFVFIIFGLSPKLEIDKVF